MVNQIVKLLILSLICGIVYIQVCIMWSLIIQLLLMKREIYVYSDILMNQIHQEIIPYI